MNLHCHIAPANSVILAMDRSVGEIPESMNGQIVAATPTCVAIGTRAETDGPTTVTLTDEVAATETLSSTFEAMVATPSHRLWVCSVLDEVFLESEVTSSSTRVQVFADDPREPSRIVLLVSPSTST